MRRSGTGLPEKRSAGSRLGGLILALLIAVVFVHDVPAQEHVQSESAVKAAFLFHFAQFTEWPASTFKDAATPLTFCTLGADPFQGELERSLSGETIGKRPVRVFYVTRIAQAQDCQIIFAGADEGTQIPALLASLKNFPVLTVGETEGFAQHGGMIGLYLEEKKMRFEINLRSAETAKLKISAKLLALARTVIGVSTGN